MKRIRWVIIPILFILACSMLPLAFTGPVQAGEGKSNLAELTAGADSVIVGTVVEHSSYWNDEHTGIYTSVVLSIEEGLKGTVDRDRITVTLPGGEADGIGQWVSDVPSFDRGEKAVVFLKKLSTAQLPKTKAYKAQLPEEQFEVYRGYQGKFAIKQGKIDNLPESKFKERVRKVAQGQTLPEGELYVPSSTATFPYSYAGYCWPHPPDPVVGYRINENTADCSGEGAAVQTAATTWNSAGAKFSFSYTGATAATGYSYNGVNEALWKNFGSGGTIAHAIIWYNGSTILENDIEFNDYYIWSAAASCPGGQFDVETIALHELGHWLCLNDLYDAADAAKVMYGYGSTGTTKRALHADDIAGIQYIYGASTTAPTVTNSTGASNITSTSARLNGELTSTGGATTTVHICWGDNDGGTGTWDHDENLGVKSTGAFYFDASGLTNSTTYYYRCYATNSAGTSWASSSSSFVAQNTVKLIGANDATGGNGMGSSYFWLFRWQAVASGNMTEFRLKSGTSGNVKCALYADSAGEPGALITAMNTGQAVVAGWNTLSFTSTAITSGTYYWLAVNFSVLSNVQYIAGSGGRRYKPATYSTFTFPDPAGTGFDGDTTYSALVAGWSTPPVLTITTTSLPNGTQGTPYSQTLQATGGSTPYSWSRTAGSLPAGLALNSSTSVISGTPSTAGTASFTIQVADSASATDTQALSITVTLPGTKLIGANDATGGNGMGSSYFWLFRWQAVASGNMTEFRLKSGASGNVKCALYADNAGEPGALITAMNTGQAVVAGWNTLSFTSTAITSGTYYWLAVNFSVLSNVQYIAGSGGRRYKPATYSTFTFPDPAGTGFDGDTTYSALVAGWGAPPILDITTTSLPNGTVGAAYSATLQATGGTGSYSWSISSGSLPAGLSLNSSTGVISGTPSSAGTSNFTAQVNDGSTTDTQSLSIIVSSPPPLSVTTASLPNGNIGSAYSATLAASGGIPPYSWAISAGSLPAGLSLNSSTGAITGTPSSAGTPNFTVQVTDSLATTATRALSITITAISKLIGADDAAITGICGAEYIVLGRFTASSSSTVSEFRIKCSGSGNVKVAIYSDSSGEPGTLLNAVNTSTPVTTGWNTISFPAISVTAGTPYWLAFNSSASIVGYAGLTGTARFKAATYSTFTFPSSAGTDFTASTANLLLAGWGAPPSPPDAPLLLSPGATITFKWGAADRATKYWLQVNTSADFTGTNVLNAEVGNVTSQEVTGLSLGTPYYWRVKAGNDAGWGNWSSTRSVLANTVP